MKNAIVINQLNVNFGQHHILHDVNIEFAQHQITVLVGHSGCGKTTLLRSLNRLNEEYTGCQTTGQVAIDFGQGLVPIYPDGKSPNLSLSTLRHRVGMVFQTPQLLPVSIYRNIAMPLELVANCSNNGEVADKVESALRQVGLFDEVKDRLHGDAEQLSGGQQQRLCLARTLALEPKVLLLDEPTSSLDIHTTKMIEALILDLREHYTIVMVSHNLEQAIKLADTILVMKKDHSIIRLKPPFINQTIHDLMLNK